MADRDPILLVLAVAVTVAIGIGVFQAVTLHDQVTTNKAQIAENQERIANDRAFVVKLCEQANREHAIIRNALIASLTEEDVQANKPQREAYEKIVERFAEPRPC